MKPKEQEIAIAEACGYTLRKHSNEGSSAWFDPQGWIVSHWTSDTNYVLPKYTSDLNAIQAAVMRQGDPQFLDEFEAMLFKVAGGCGWICSMTAAQWCEAFLRTLNLWRESTDNNNEDKS